MPRFLRVKLGQHGGNAVEHALDVHINHRVPIRRFQRGKRRVGHQTRVEKNRIHFAKRFFGQRHQRGVVFGFHHIGNTIHHLAAIGLDLVGNRFKLRFTARAQHDFRTLGRQLVGRGLANAR